MLDRKSTIGILITLIILALIGVSLYLGKKYCCAEEDIEICPSCPSGICIIPGQPNSFYNMDSACNNPGNDKYGGAGCDYLSGKNCRLCGFSSFPPCVQKGPPKCKSNVDCKQPEECIDGSCAIPQPTNQCTKNSDCKQGQFCDQGKCENVPPHSGCTKNSDCGTGTCINGKCISGKSFSVDFKNETGSTLLIGASGPSPVKPREGSWYLKSGATITLDIPADWLHTASRAVTQRGVVGPRFWARTGCALSDIYWQEIQVNGKATPIIMVGSGEPKPASVCTDGSPGCVVIGTKWINTDDYSLWSKSSGTKWVKVTEWDVHVGSGLPSTPCSLGNIYHDKTANKWYMCHQKAQCETGNCTDSFDCNFIDIAGTAPVSLAEFCFDCGDDLTYYDVSLVDGYNISIDIIPGSTSTKQGDPFWNITGLCNKNTDLRSSAPDKFTLKRSQLPQYQPGQKDYSVAVFSNCGYYEYPKAPDGDCDPEKDPKCKNWRQFCCQSSKYGDKCVTDSDCDSGGSCWNGTCQCKAYYKCKTPGPTLPSNKSSEKDGKWPEQCCSESVCFENRDPAAQPIPGGCTSPDDCIGDDSFHQVCPYAYSWPNDPTTFSSDATNFTIVFSPGGSSYGNITDVSELPFCKDLDETYYDVKQQMINCGSSKMACANNPSKTGHPWACGVENPGANCGNGLGVLCRMK